MIANVVNSDTGEPRTRLNYYKKGLSFQFREGKLTSFGRVGDNESTPAGSWKDLGDVTELRDIGCDDWEKPTR